MERLIIFCLVIFGLFAAVRAQNVTNLLGTNGTYKIKSSSADFFTVTQSTGRVSFSKTIRLENTTSASVGVVYLGNDRFLHNYELGGTYLGINSGSYITSLFNTAVGQLTLFSSSGSANSAFGYLSMGFNSTGTGNSAFGYGAMLSNLTGNYNSAFGSYTMFSSTSGAYNSAFGDSSLAANSSGDSNSAFGSQSLGLNTTGSQNSAFGRQSLFLNTTGNFNTAVGHLSGYNTTTGSNLTCIGSSSQPSTGNAVNQFTLGNNTIQSLRCNVTSITSLSDARDKKNIKDLALGIDFLMTLKPRLYNWDKREWYESNISDGTKMQETQTAGFIAQELDEAQTNAKAEWLNLVMKDNPEKWEATPGNLMPVIVKAVQELKQDNEKLITENDELIKENLEYEKLLTELEHAQNILVLEIKNMKTEQNEINEVKLGEILK